jgi:iron complex outermembrane receptor protein
MRSTNKHFHASLMITTTALALLATPAVAQTAPDAGSGSDAGDIVVTATRRSQSLIDVPLAVSAVSGEALAQANVVSFQDLTRVDPSLAIQNYGAAVNQFIIRGIESETAATTGLYFDEVPLLGGEPTEGGGDGSPSLRLLDLNRVEVLKGPQGTLFGSGSMAGTIRLITNKPELDKFGGTVSSSIAAVKGGEAFYQGNAVLNVPLTPTLAIRAVGWMELGGGYIDQIYGGTTHKDVNTQFVRGGRITGLWQPVDEFSLTATAVHQQIKVDGTQNYDEALGAYKSSATSQEPYKDNFDLYDVTAAYDLGFGAITASGSYSSFDFYRPKDTTPTNQFFGLPGTARYAQDQQFRAYTGELRFASTFEGPVQIVAGAFYQNDLTKFQDAAVQTDPISGKSTCDFYYQCIDNGGIGTLEYATALRRKVSQYALYGQADWEIVPALTATVGLRYFHAKIHDEASSLQDIGDWFGGIVTTPYVTQDDRTKEHKTSYNFALRYEFDKDLAVYARVASGFRIGGTNNSENAANNFGIIIPGAYNPDNLWDYEAGVKASLFDRALYLDWSVYRIDWKGQQLPATDSTGAFTYVINAGKTRIYGSELQATVKPTNGLNLSLGVTYTNAKLADDLPAEVLAGGVVGFDGDRVPRVPKWSFNASGEYETPISGTLSAYLGGSLTHRGSSFYEFESDPAGLTLNAYTLVNARLGIRTAGGWDLGLYGENLTDKAAQMGLYSSLDGTKVYSPRPRTIGLRFSGKF